MPVIARVVAGQRDTAKLWCYYWDTFSRPVAAKVRSRSPMMAPRSRCPSQRDRAVFHFLTTDEQRGNYVRQVLKALKPGGFAIVGTFGPEGPKQCSGLPVARYAPDELHDTFGDPFQLVESSVEIHTTPWGSPQQFVYCFCRRQGKWPQAPALPK